MHKNCLFRSGLLVDELTLQPPHLMAPGNLVNLHGDLYNEFEIQRLVPGRENLSREELRAQVDAEKNSNGQINALFNRIIIEPLKQELKE